MDFRFSPEEERFREDVLHFLDTEVTDEMVEEVERGTDIGLGPHTWELMRRIGKKRWLAPAFPKEYGGIENEIPAARGPTRHCHRGVGCLWYLGWHCQHPYMVFLVRLGFKRSTFHSWHRWFGFRVPCCLYLGKEQKIHAGPDTPAFGSQFQVVCHHPGNPRVFRVGNHYLCVGVLV